MLKSKFIVSALIASLCVLSLASCAGNTTTGGDSDSGTTATTAQSESGGIVGDVESGMEDIGSDIKDNITDVEDATHGIEESNGMEGTSHRSAVPFGK